MKLKTIGVGLSAAVLTIAAIALLRSVSSEASDITVSSTPTADRSPRIPSSPQPPSRSRTTIVRVTQSETGQPTSIPPNYDEHLKDPQGGYKVKALIGQNLGSPEAKVKAIRMAIIDSGTCGDNICKKTKDALTARVESARTLTPVPLTSTPIECYQLGCLVDVSVPSGVSLQVLLNRLQVERSLAWPVPSIYSRPKIEADRRQSAMWVLFNPSSDSKL